MLNRRYIRVKVFQALYSFYQSENKDRELIEKGLLKSINNIFDLYVLMLAFLVEMKDIELKRLENAKTKIHPTPEDLNPNTKFVDSKVIQLIENNEKFKKHVDLKNLSWFLEETMVKKILKAIKEGEEYDKFMNSKGDFNDEKNFLTSVFKKYIWNSEDVEEYISDKSIYWLDDLAIVNVNVVKTINNLSGKLSPESDLLIPLFKDKVDDMSFVKELFRKTISFDKEYIDLIKTTTKNWESDRIVKLDLILMKMALCEIQHFKNIPIKVTLNEYIELAKDYSTPKSKIFINGVLDKLVKQLKDKGEILKMGRGLME